MPVSTVPAAVKPSPAAERPPSRAGRQAQWLILACYLLGAVAVTWRLWVDPAGRMPAGNVHDVDAFAWFIRYAATAVSHGRLPALVTTALNAPRGVNLMWNTSFLLPGMLLAPVTLLAGPQVSLTAVLTLGFAGSAASLFWVLRRWGASLSAAALGGAVYGFSPALVNSGIGHYNLQFAVLPPLIIDALLRILTGRGHPVLAGAWLGLLVGAQVFVGEELLADTAVAGLLLMVVLAVQRPRAALQRAPAAALGLVTSAAVALLICGHAVLVQLYGPLREHSVLQNSWVGNPAYFVDPPGTLLFHTSASATAVSDFPLGTAEVLAYLGWPLLAVLTLCAIWFWRDLRVRTAAVVFVVLALCSLGGGHQGFYPRQLMPWFWLQNLPVLTNALPNRFSILADGAAAVMLAFSLDLARSRVQGRDWRRGIPLAVGVLAAFSLIPLPYQAAPVSSLPAGWQAAFARLRLAPGARVLVVPIPNVARAQSMHWQADTGEPGSMIGGYFLGPAPGTGQPVLDVGPAKPAEKYLNGLWAGTERADGSSAARIRAGLASWRPAAVIAVTSPGSPLGHALIEVFGPPGFRGGQVLAWRVTPTSR
jgi:hypothetical protein